jgi:Flp pilus assembly protein TadD
MNHRSILLRGFAVATALATTQLFSAAAFAVGTETTPATNAENADYTAGQKWVEAKDWKRAVASFERATGAEPKNADAWNMLGYSRRWAGDVRGAFAAYDRALTLDPNHRGATSYLGMAHLRNDDVGSAKAQLAKLQRLCGQDCYEYKRLAEAISQYTPNASKQASGYAPK